MFTPDRRGKRNEKRAEHAGQKGYTTLIDCTRALLPHTASRARAGNGICWVVNSNNARCELDLERHVERSTLHAKLLPAGVAANQQQMAKSGEVGMSTDGF